MSKLKWTFHWNSIYNGGIIQNCLWYLPELKGSNLHRRMYVIGLIFISLLQLTHTYVAVYLCIEQCLLLMKLLFPVIVVFTAYIVNPSSKCVYCKIWIFPVLNNCNCLVIASLLNIFCAKKLIVNELWSPCALIG